MAPEKITLNLHLLTVGDNFVALAHVGGVNLRGNAAPTKAGAVAALLTAMGQNSGHNNSDMALEFLVSGEALSDLLSGKPALEGGSD